MGDVYLNKSIKFKCVYNAVFNAALSSSNVSIKGEKAILATTPLTCISPGVCPLPECLLPNGQPGPCIHFGKLHVSPNWTDTSSAALKVNGQKVLSSSSFCPCSLGIKITPEQFGSINVSDSVSSFDVSFTDSSHEDICENKTSANENADSLEESFLENCKYALCNYKNCDKARECKYINTPHSIRNFAPFDGDADLLKKNMANLNREIYDSECNKITETLSCKNINYQVQHHHMISSLQCYDKLPELVKIGNFYGFNINNAYNGICLPSGGGYSASDDLDEKTSISFGAMDQIGKQWHVGGHSMKLLINSLQKIPAFVEKALGQGTTSVITSYDQSVRDLLNKFLLNNKNKYMDSCRLENYEKQSEEFKLLMNRIADRLRQKLINFNVSPDADSFKWFYISKMSLYYAYEDILKDCWNKTPMIENKRKLGLVLAGGGGKGAYQIGVWKYLHEIGLDSAFSVVSGTSVGALNAVLFANGDIELAERIWTEQIETRILSDNTNRIFEGDSFNFGTIFGNIITNGLFSRDGLCDIINREIDLNFFRSCKKHVYATCTRLPDMTGVPFLLNNLNKETCIQALLATSAIPGVFKPERVESGLYYDGGIVPKNNIPVLPVEEELCSHVVVIPLNRESEVKFHSLSDSDVTIIRPSADLGNLLGGTLNFTSEKARTLIALGYSDASTIYADELQRIVSA